MVPILAFLCDVLFYRRVPEQSWPSCGSVKSVIRSPGTAPWRRELPLWPTACSTGMINFEIEPKNIEVSTVWRTQRLKSFMGSRKAKKAKRHWGRLRTGMAELPWTLIISCHPRSSKNLAWFCSGQEPFQKSYRVNKSCSRK